MDYVDDELYASDSASKDYFYFLKLVPHIFIDEIHDESYHSYSYSLNHNSKVRSRITYKDLGLLNWELAISTDDLRFRSTKHENH